MNVFLETDEEKENRLKSKQKSMQTKRANETPQQIAERNEKNKKNMANKRKGQVLINVQLKFLIIY